MSKGSITIVGLGPGAAGHISLETLQLLESGRKVILRTAVHPTVEELEKRNISFTSCDDLYDAGNTFEEVYGNVVERVLEAAEETDVVYAVPGSPLVAERTVVMMKDEARARGVEITIRPAMSFLEVAYVALEADPIDGLRIIDATDFGGLADAGKYPLMITQVYDPLVASDMKLALMDVLDDEADVFFLKNLGMKDQICRKVKLYEVDRQEGIDHLTSVFVPKGQRNDPCPPLDANCYRQKCGILPRPGECMGCSEESPSEEDDESDGAGSGFSDFDITPLSDVMQVLRQPGGCPWDREQDFRSIRANLIEECYEYLEAVDNEDTDGMREELGDILMQVVFHARMAQEEGLFDLQDVIDTVTDKLIDRHPHVFGETEVSGSDEVLRNWEAIKQEEKPERVHVLDGLTAGLPALLQAYKIQKKVAKVGFDWTDIDPVRGKVEEEWQEFNQAVAEHDAEAMEDELGDLYFSLVNYARHLGVESETALTKCNGRFRKRFSHVERRVLESGKNWDEYTLEELDRFWNEAKEQEK